MRLFVTIRTLSRNSLIIDYSHDPLKSAAHGTLSFIHWGSECFFHFFGGRRLFVELVESDHRGRCRRDVRQRWLERLEFGGFTELRRFGRFAFGRGTELRRFGWHSELRRQRRLDEGRRRRRHARRDAGFVDARWRDAGFVDARRGDARRGGRQSRLTLGASQFPPLPRTRVTCSRIRGRAENVRPRIDI